MTATGFVPRPHAAFRVGVTGAIALSKDEKILDHLRGQLAAVLGLVKARVELHAAATDVYAPGPPLLRLLSPLAEGSDRLVAEAGLALGYQLDVPLPFPQTAYEEDFPETQDQFRALLAQAGPRVLEIDGAHGKATGNLSYEAVGRLVARNCDLLIAIWDGGPGNGRGGTADIVRFAARSQTPVWWLRADGSGAPCWIASLPDLRRPGACAAGAAQARLEAYIRNAILPPPPDEKRGSPDKLRDFLAESPRRDRPIWRVYAGVMRLAAGRRPKPPPGTQAPAGATPAGDVWPYWAGFYAPADRLSVDYANRYRSSYVLIFGFAAFAFWFSVLGTGYGLWTLLANGVELAALLVIAGIVLLNLRWRWHERLITYRLLSELFRKQQALALLGWTVPPAEATHISGDLEPLAANIPRDIWVGWYFNAVVRASPLPQGRLAGPQLAAIAQAISLSLIAGQVGYQHQREQASRTAAERFGQLGRGFFWGTIIVVAVKFALLCYLRKKGLPSDTGLRPWIERLREIQGLLPGLSAAFVGIRGYAELELLADQSAQMQRLLIRTESNLRGIDLAAPLASQELGAEILALAEAMLLDIKGWAQLFRVKVVEPG